MSDNVLTGVVCWFDKRKGYGYVTRDDGAGDMFIHFSNVLMEGYKFLEAGQKVAFEVGKNHKGPQCVNLKKAE